MIRFVQVQKSFGVQPVLLGVSFDVPSGQTAALVGPNGAGKSTLIRIAAGEEAADGGRVVLDVGARVAYLPQDAGVRGDRTLWDEMLAAFAELSAVRYELDRIETDVVAAAAAGRDLHRLVERQGHLHERFDALDGYRVEAEIHTVLAGLGFRPQDRERAVSEFSGGWQMRIALGKLLVQRPEVLLLDEPTNHLDIAATEWLEEYLRTYSGSVLLVSHDRYFLDRVAARTVELHDGVATVYQGGYSAYVVEKERRREAQQAAYERQQKYLGEQRAFVERFRASATRTTQAQSRERQLDKLELVDKPPPPPPAVALRFAESRPSAQEVAVLEGVAKRYGEHLVLDGVSLRLERGDRLALIGPNGQGKSTLLRILAGLEPPSEGRAWLSDSAVVGYFAQSQAEALDPTRTILEELRANASAVWGEDRLRALAGRFLFSGEDVFKPIGTLSGGQKSRVALAKLLLRPANVLLLDEPTNHLDPLTKERLEEALRRFHGTVIIASHDRFLLDRVATRIGEVADTALRLYLGSYSEVRQQRATQAGAQAAVGQAATAGALQPTTANGTAAARGSNGTAPAQGSKTGSPQARGASSTQGNGTASAPLRQGASSNRRRGGKGVSPLAALEAELDRRVRERRELEARLESPEGEDVATLGQQHVVLEQAIAELEARWELLAEEASA